MTLTHTVESGQCRWSMKFKGADTLWQKRSKISIFIFYMFGKVTNSFSDEHLTQTFCYTSQFGYVRLMKPLATVSCHEY